MALTSGARLGPYEILTPLGRGGMGEVYRARDTKLKREVAIKVLPAECAKDPDRLARTQREAEILASLNHPNIAQIYGQEDAGGTPCLVLELVDGETIAERLRRGPIPVGEALEIARQIASALEAAHEKGVIHRDLKPANAQVTPSGTVKVLDFGLAKVNSVESAGAALSNSPTMVASMPGAILGTVAYMSPEQAKGQDADQRSDVWAFGCVLYEMLSGRAPFAGESVSEIVSEVLKTDPDWRRLPAGTPEAIRRLLRRCLQKNRKERQQHLGDARIELGEAQIAPPAEAAEASSARSYRKERLGWVLAVAALMLIAAGLAVLVLRARPAPAEMRLEITTPPTSDLTSLAISPDGRTVVFAARGESRSQLWLRSLDSVSARPLPRTDSAYFPFWSPDGRSIGFFAEGKLKRVDIEAGSVQILADATAGRGGAWTRDGTILFAPQAGPIYRIPAAGGERVPVTPVDAQRRNQRFPQLLPGGSHFLSYSTTDSARGEYISRLDGSEMRRLLDADAAAVYSASGHLLFVRQGTLFAQSFDAGRLELTGDPFPVAKDVAFNVGVGIAALSSSPAGPVIYRAGLGRGPRQLVWLDRSGKEIGKAGEPDEAITWGPSMSPDGRNVALTRTVNGNQDVWLLDTSRRVSRRFTSDAGADSGPIWSPDGRRIVFNSSREGLSTLFLMQADGTGAEAPLLPTALARQWISSGATFSLSSDWSPDGRFLLFRSQSPKTRYDLWALQLDGNRTPFPVVQTNFDERDGQFSPDGKWIAYESDETGRFEIYMQPFPGPGVKVPVSTSGGAQVRWPREGGDVFYIALDERLMAVPVRLDSSRQTAQAGAPVPLFTTHVGGAVTVERQQYMVSPDGRRFLMNTIVEGALSPITVMLNWTGRHQ